MDSRKGETLQNGKYCLEEEIGQGGFGITYRATLVETGKTVVIKTPKSHLLAKDVNFTRYVKQFNKEAKALEKLPIDPHLVQIRDVFKEGDIPYLVMNFIEGQTLLEVLRYRKVIPEKEAVDWIATIAETMIKVHAIGLVHCDLHPSNIMLCAKKQPVLIDFSIAHDIQPLSKSTVHSGGHEIYAPFEQLYKKSKDPRVDVYTLAATLYHLITGEPPKSSGEISFQNAKLILPKSINPSVSDRTNNAIRYAMEFHPDNRPPSMEAWLKILVGDRKPPIFSRRRFIQYGALSAGALVTAVVSERVINTLRSNDRKPLVIPAPPEPALKSLSLKEQTFKSVTLDEFGKIPQETAGKNRYLEEDLGNGIKLRMMMIPKGDFTMGSPDQEALRSDSEGPVRQVKVFDFFMGQLTVTQAQWRAVAQLPQVRRSLSPNPAFFTQKDNHPIERVNWSEAVEFCDRLAKKTNRPYRLPSEAEWEYACRAGTTTPFHLGATITTDFANYRGTDDDQGDRGKYPGNYGKGPKGKYRGQTVEANEFPPNAFGLHNMHGNVWEWCADPWSPSYETPLKDSRSLVSDNNDVDRVIRGGSWSNSPQFCRSACRIFFPPGNRNNNLGFRVIFRLRPQDS
jgi:formylglycine-generating enzyme required for sulfatase activity/tRNA A-37 threonylcarbamoyl transferase component Bud32